jgi:hypothetical protein
MGWPDRLLRRRFLIKRRTNEMWPTFLRWSTRVSTVSMYSLALQLLTAYDRKAGSDTVRLRETHSGELIIPFSMHLSSSRPR